MCWLMIAASSSSSVYAVPAWVEQSAASTFGICKVLLILVEAHAQAVPRKTKKSSLAMPEKTLAFGRRVLTVVIQPE